MILIDRTFETVSAESAKEGEIADSGFITINERFSFRELVAAMRSYSFTSCSPASGEIYEWLETEPEQDYLTGEYRSEALHYSRDNPAKNAKYWRKAMIFAGKVVSA